MDTLIEEAARAMYNHDHPDITDPVFAWTTDAYQAQYFARAEAVLGVVERRVRAEERERQCQVIEALVGGAGIDDDTVIAVLAVIGDE